MSVNAGAYILVVDDNADNLYVLTHLLTRRGYSVRGVGDGPSALAAVEEDLPALVLLDIRLPGFSGYQVVAALRLRPGFGETPVIAVTAHAMAGDREAALAAGCNDYMTKPIDPHELVTLVERFLGPAPAGRS
ncbi:MAG TPA: response regulator [Chloroflexota bacterium]|nr:response regulator [Chloroflexota bacterium]